MPLIKLDQKIYPGDEIRVDDSVSLAWAIIGPVSPIVQTPQGNHLPHKYSVCHCTGERVEEWTYKSGPVEKAMLVTKDGYAKLLWLGWR